MDLLYFNLLFKHNTTHKPISVTYQAYTQKEALLEGLKSYGDTHKLQTITQITLEDYRCIINKQPINS